MLRYSRLTLILVIFAIVTAVSISLSVTRTVTWAHDSGAQEKEANHAHDTKDGGHAHGEHTHGSSDSGHVHGEHDDDHPHGSGDDGHAHDGDSHHPHADEDTVTLSDKAKANIGLKTAETAMRTIERGVQVHGHVIPHPSGRIDVTPRIGGIVRSIHFSLGDSPDRGDVLLELESIDLQMAQIGLIEAAAQQKSLVAKQERLTEVFAKQIRRELQTRQIDYLQSLSELETAPDCR